MGSQIPSFPVFLPLLFDVVDVTISRDKMELT
jgi:hypothetical protein